MALLILVGADAARWQNRSASLERAVRPDVAQQLENTNRETSKYDKNSQEYPYDFIVKVLTLALGVATLGVLGFQAWIYWRQVGIMRGAREAADQQSVIMTQQREILDRQTDIAEQAMTIGDWPRVLVQSQFFSAPISPYPAMWPPGASYTLIFLGRNPAVLRSVQNAILFINKLPPITEVDLGAAYMDAIKYDGDTHDDATQMAHDVAIPVEEELFGRAESSKSYFLIGRILYDDVFGNEHEFGFCYQGNVSGGRGVLAGGTAYNYRRTRKRGELANDQGPKVKPVPPPPETPHMHILRGPTIPV